MKNMISTKFKYFFDGFGQYVVFTTKKQCKEYLKANPNINRIKDLKEIGIEEWNKISEHPRDQVFEIIDNVAVPLEIINVKDEPISEQIQYEDCPNCADQASIARNAKMKMEIERFDAKTEEETIIDLDIAIKEIYKCLSSSPYGFSYNDLSTENKIKDQLLAGKDIDTFEATYCLHLINYPNCADHASIAAPGQTVLCKTHADENHFREMKEFFIEEVERITFRPHLPLCSCCGKETSQYVGIIVTNSSGPLSFSFCIDCRDELTLKQNAARATLERIGA